MPVIIATKIDRDRVARFKFELDATRQIILIAGAIGHIAIMLHILASNADSSALAKRRVQGAVELDRIIIAVRDRRISAKLAQFWLAGDDVDRTAGCVAAIKGALRAFQDFDPVDVIEHATG